MSPDRLARLILSAIIVLGFGSVLIAWMIWPPKPDSGNILSALAAVLGSGYLTVIHYWFIAPGQPEAKP